MQVATRQTANGTACKLPLVYAGQLLTDCMETAQGQECIADGTSAMVACSQQAGTSKELSELMLTGSPAMDGEISPSCCWLRFKAQWLVICAKGGVVQAVHASIAVVCCKPVPVLDTWRLTAAGCRHTGQPVHAHVPGDQQRTHAVQGGLLLPPIPERHAGQHGHRLLRCLSGHWQHRSLSICGVHSRLQE